MLKILEKLKNIFSGKIIFKPKKKSTGQEESKTEKKSEEQK